MKQPAHMKKNNLISKMIFMLILCTLLITAISVQAHNDEKKIALNQMQEVSTGSDSMFSNESVTANGTSPAPFKAELEHNLSDSITVTATGSQYPVKLIPLTLSQSVGRRTGNRITYEVEPGVHIIYTFKGNGVKEDIVFDHPSVSAVDLAFRLELDAMLVARFD